MATSIEELGERLARMERQLQRMEHQLMAIAAAVNAKPQAVSWFKWK